MFKPGDIVRFKKTSHWIREFPKYKVLYRVVRHGQYVYINPLAPIEGIDWGKSGGGFLESDLEKL